MAGKAATDGLPGYETTRQAADRLGMEDSRVRQLCIAGRLPGAVKVGRQWLMAEDSTPEPTGFGRPLRGLRTDRQDPSFAVGDAPVE